jgi:hypothetical protein
MTADAPAFFEIFLQGSVSLLSRIPDPLVNAHRGTAMRPWFTHPFIKTLSFKARPSALCALRAAFATGSRAWSMMTLRANPTHLSPRRAGRGRSDRSPLLPQPKLIPLWFGFAASAAAGALAGSDADVSVYLGSLSARMSILWMAGGLASRSLAFAISAAATLPLR